MTLFQKRGFSNLCNDQMTFQLVRSILNIHENIKVKFPGMENTSKND